MTEDEEVIGINITKKSKPISELKQGDNLFINGKKMTIDSHYVFMEHKDTKEMILEFYNPDNGREYQLRYFDDQMESSAEVYELQGDFQYIKRQPKTLEW